MDRISRFFEVRYAFLGCSLQKGTKGIAIGHIAFYSFFLSMGIVITSQNDQIGYLESLNETVNKTDDWYEEMFDDKDHFMDLSRSYFHESVLVIQIVFGICLLLGVTQKLPDYLMSWVLMQAAQSLFSQFFVVVYFVAVLDEGSYYIKYLLVDELTITVIELYFIAIVLSYYKQLVKESQDEYLSPIIDNTQEELPPLIINNS